MLPRERRLSELIDILLRLTRERRTIDTALLSEPMRIKDDVSIANVSIEMD